MVVQKFGGTSVADPDAIRRLIEIVRTARVRDGAGPAVVVSAMSGITDDLLRLATDAAAGRASEAHAGVARIRDRHLAAAADLAPGNTELVTSLTEQCQQLDAVVGTVSTLRELTPRMSDVVAATGELLSSRLVAAALLHAGLNGEWVDSRRVVVTSADHMQARPLDSETNAALRASVGSSIEAGRVPVLGGFVGATPDGHTTTLGRGGSDYSGALVGAGIGASEIQIWTDVDGMLTADPRVVASPRLVPRLSFAEAAELAYFGAKVLHPATILPAVEHDIPVRILNSRRQTRDEPEQLHRNVVREFRRKPLCHLVLPVRLRQQLLQGCGAGRGAVAGRFAERRVPEHMVPVGMRRETRHDGPGTLAKVVREHRQLVARDSGVDEEDAGFAVHHDAVALNALALVHQHTLCDLCRHHAASPTSRMA